MGTYPMVYKLLLCVFYQTSGWVGNVIPHTFMRDAIQNNEMVLVPMQYAWQCGFAKHLQRNPS